MPRPTGSSGTRSSGSRSSGSRSSGHRSAGSGLRSSGHRSAGSGRPTGGSGFSGGVGIRSRRPAAPPKPRRQSPPPPRHRVFGFGAPPPARSRRWHTYGSGYYDSSPGYSAHRRTSHPFLTSFIIVCLLVGFFVFLGRKAERAKTPVQNSAPTQDKTVQTDAPKRSKLQEGLCRLTNYYEDELGYLSEKCEEGLKYFYQKTNVQPVVLTMDISKVSDYDDHEELSRFYSEMFEDEAHFLFIIFGDKEGSVDWEYSYIAGADAVSVMDDDAVDTLFVNIDNYYYDSNASDDELVSNAFRDTADKIMK